MRQKNSPNDGPDAALEDTFYVVLEGVPYRWLWRAMEEAQEVEKRMHLTLHLMVHLKVHLSVQFRT